MHHWTTMEERDVDQSDAWQRSPDSPRFSIQPSILFVCTANRIRSPLAEHLLRSVSAAQLGGVPWRIESAGIWADDGLTAASAARRAGLERDLDLSHHRSRSVRSIALDEFDLILGMERSHCQQLMADYPQHAARILTLSEVVTGKPYDIIDPPGHTLRSVRATLRDLARLIENGMMSMLTYAEAAANR